MVAKAKRGKSMETGAKHRTFMVRKEIFTFMSMQNLPISLVHFLYFPGYGCGVSLVVLGGLVPGTFVLCFGTGGEVQGL